MADIIAEGVVKVGVDDNTSAELARIQAEYEAAMRNLSREEATLKIKGDIGDLKAKVDEAKAKLRELEAQEKAEAARNEQLSAQQKSASTRRLADIRKEIEATKEQVRTDETRSKALQGQLQLTQQQQREEALAEKARQASAKAASDREKIRAQSDAAAIKAQRDLTSSRLSDLASQREAINLQQRFIAAQKEADALSKQIGRTKPGETRQTVTLDRAKVVLEMEEIKARLAAMGRDPVKQEVKLDTNAATKAWNLWTKGTLSGSETKTTLDDLGKQIGKLFSTRLNIGPITASVGGMIAALGSLAPIIGGLIGAFSSLVSVAGAGLVGALGLGGAAMSGFGLAAVGALTAFHPIISQLEVAHAAMQKYQKAVQTYGENSKQAQQAQKQLNNTLAALPVPVQQAVKGFQTLSNAYEKATHPQAMRTFSQVTSSALKTLSADMGFFARDTNHAMAAAGQGFASWMAALRSAAARHILDNIFQNFNRSIPSIMSGLSSIGAALGRWFSTMSNYLPGLSRDFAVWAAHVDEAAKRTNGWASGSAKLVDAFKSIISFVGAAGRVIISFFKAGVEPGVGWVDQMTGSLNKLADSMNTVAGQQKLQNFFAQSISVTKEVFNALQPLFAVFVHLAALFAPLANAMLPIIQFFGQLAASVTGALGPLGKVIVDVAAFIAVGRLLGRLNPLLGIFSLLRGGFASVSTAAKGAAEAIKAFAASEGIINRVKAAWSAWTSRGTAAAGAAAGASETATSIETASTAGAAKMGSSIETAATAGATEIGSTLEGAGTAVATEISGAMEAAGTAVAAEIGGAMEAAGASTAAENAASRSVGTVGPAVTATGAAGEIEAAFQTGGASAAGEIEAAFQTGGASAAAEIGTAMRVGGAAGGAGAAGSGLASSLASRLTGGGTAVAQEAGATTQLGTAAAGAETSVAGLGATLGGAAVVIGGAVAVTYGLTKAFQAIAGSAPSVTSGINAAKDSVKQFNAAWSAAQNAKKLPSLSDAQVGPKADQATAQKTANDALATYNRLVAEGKGGTQAATDALNQYNSSVLQVRASQQAQNDALARERQLHQQTASTLDTSVRRAYKDVTTAQNSYDQATKDVNAQLQIHSRNSVEVQSALAKQRTAAAALAAAQANLNGSLKAQHAAENLLIVDSLNQQRVAAGRISLTDKQAVGVGNLINKIKEAGNTKALDQLIKLPNPADVQRVAAAFNQLTSGGDQTKAINIVANAKTAQDAINGINGLVLHEKTLKVNTNLGDSVIQLAKIQGVKLTPKQLNILHHGDTEAILAVAKVAGVKIDPKIMRIFGDIQDALRKHDTVRAIKDINKILRFLGDPSGAVNAANTAKRTIGGVPGQKLSRFLGDRANLNAVASGAISAIRGVPNQKLSRFLGDKANLDATASGAISSVRGVPGTHNTDLNATDNTGAVIGAVQGALAGLQPVNIPVTMTFSVGGNLAAAHKAGVLGEGGVIPGYAAGGSSKRSEDLVYSMIQKVLSLPVRKRKTQGEQVSSPTFLVGEENLPEFVIATNPAYRERNKRLLVEAAHAIGMEAFKKGGGTPFYQGPRPKGVSFSNKGGSGNVPAGKVEFNLEPAARIAGVGDTDIQNYLAQTQATLQQYLTQKNPNKSIIGKLKREITALTGLKHTADEAAAKYDNITQAAQNVQNYMSTAATKQDQHAQGFDYHVDAQGNLGHHPKSVYESWGHWKNVENDLLDKRIAMLNHAINVAEGDLSYLKDDPISRKYIGTLESALSQAQNDKANNVAATAPTAPVVTAESWISFLGETEKLAKAKYELTRAQGTLQTDTAGSPQYQADLQAERDKAAAVAFEYQSILSKATAYPFTATNYSLLDELQTSVNQATAAYLSINDAVNAVGPTQVQLSDTARGNLYKSFASNIAPAILGGQAAGAQFTPQNPAMLPSAPSIASEPHGSTTTVNVTNHYQTQPEDPHAWSQGLAWELGAAL